MPTRFDISNFKVFNQNRNDSDFLANTSEFTNNPVGNVLEAVKLSYDAVFNYFSNASITTNWIVKAGKITRSAGNFQTTDGLVVGDVFLFFADWANFDTSTEEFEATITGFSDGGQTVLFTVNSGAQSTTGEQTNVGFICDPNDSANNHSAMINRFGLVENNDPYSNENLTTDSPQAYAIAGMTGITTAIAGTIEGTIKDWVTGSLSAYISSVDTANYTVTYTVEHEIIINPSYRVDYLNALLDNTVPDLFSGDASLKYTAQILLRKTKTDTATTKQITFDTLQGSVGWFGENFNGSPSVYSASLSSYTDTANATTETALQINRKTTATLILSKTIALTAGQVVMAYVQYLPANISEYSNTTTDYQANFLYDSIRLTEGAGDVAGSDIIKRGNASLLGDDIVIELDVEYTTDQANKVESDGGYYLIALQAEDSTKTVGNSDRAMQIADIRQYQALGNIEGLLSFTNFSVLDHGETLNTDAGSVFKDVWDEDGLLLDFAFDMDLSKSAVLEQLQIKLVAFKTLEETYFELDSYTIDCTQFPISGGVQQLDLDTIRGYNLAESDQFNLVQLSTGGRVGDIQSYTGAFGQKITWQDWIENLNADPVFYDNSKLNNNLNFKSSNYSGLEGYEIKIIAEATLTGIDELGNEGVGFETGEVEAITVRDYGITDDGIFSAVDVVTRDSVTAIDLEGQIYADAFTLVRAEFTTASPSLSNIWAIIRLYEKNIAGNNLIAELSSFRPYPENNALLPVEGENFLKLTTGINAIFTEGLINPAQINPEKTYYLTGRIEKENFTLSFFTVFNTAVSGTLVAQATNSVTGAWVSGTVIQNSNTLSTTDTYFDGTQRVVTYSASDFSGLTDLNINDAQAAGLLDLNIASLTGFTVLDAQNNNFDNIDFGTWVQSEGVDIDVTNSIIDAETLEPVIDNLIIANGGTTTDDGVNYTGSPGASTVATRPFDLGTIIVDITTLGILYEKIVALNGVNWNINTILALCLKNRVLQTDDQDYIAFTVDDNFAEIEGIDNINSDSLVLSYYDTIANAQTGGATGLLAQGIASINTYLSGTGWSSGEALRVENSLTNTLQSAQLNYTSAPIAEVPCGLQDAPIISGNGQFFDGSFDYDIVNAWTELERDEAWTMLIEIDLQTLANTQTLFMQGATGTLVSGSYTAQRGFAISVIATTGEISIIMTSGAGNDVLVRFAGLRNGYNSVAITYSGNSQANGFAVKANGQQLSRNIIRNTLSSTILQPVTKTITLGAGQLSGGISNFSTGIFRKTQILTGDYKLTADLDEAERIGTFEGVLADSEFLLDIEFNKTSGNPTTRSLTPSYTISHFGAGSPVYNKYTP